MSAHLAARSSRPSATPVNLASRLEQLTKEYPARLIVSDSMMAALGATAGAARPLGKVAVRGYTEPVPIWGLD
jgi:adenylate cyclase